MNKRVHSRLLSPRLLFVVLTVLGAAAIAARAQSPTGAQGATGIPDTSNVVTNWNPSVAYKAGQVVYCAVCSVNGSKYVALLSNINVDPPSNLGNIWQLVAEAGAHSGTGATGATGATGSSGEPSPSSPAPPPSPALRKLL